MPLRKLPTFKGYTVDVRLREFRKFVRGQLLEIINFDSNQGRKLIEELREEGYTTPMMEFEEGKFVCVDNRTG